MSELKPYLILYVRHLQDLILSECGDECRKCLEILEREKAELEEMSTREFEKWLFKYRT